MRLLLFLTAALVATGASAQPFRLVSPALSVDGRPVGVVGAPLAQERFEALAIRVPGVGTFLVYDSPTDGARLAGQFDGDGLYVTAGGLSVRLRAAAPILDGGVRSAFVRLDPDGADEPRGLARVSVVSPPGYAAQAAPEPADNAPRVADAMDEAVRGVSLSAFDAARLRNGTAVQQRLGQISKTVTVPPGGADVLVLFQTDSAGRVVRVAAAQPTGGGLDAAAEALVQDMRFDPPRVGGVPTGFRSQARVRFEP